MTALSHPIGTRIFWELVYKARSTQCLLAIRAGSWQESVCFAILVVAIVAARMVFLAPRGPGWYFITVQMYIFII